MQKKDDTRINRDITAREVRLIGNDGHNYGVVTIQEALRLADQAGIDLVEISPMASPPVCKILDYGKYRYEMQKKAREAHKNQKVVEIKEVKMRPVIDKHDFESKMNNSSRFIGEGNKVKISIMFRRREMDHQELGHALMDRAKAHFGESAKIEQEPRMEGRNMTMMVAPK